LYVNVSSGSPVLHDTLIAGNFQGATGTTRDDVSGPLDPSGDYNLIGDGTGMTGLSNGVNGNLVGSADNPIDPQLGPLDDNGGPTLTHALLSGSPAIDAGNNAYATDWDQRGPGYPRIVNGIIDIGAFEVQQDGGSAPGRFSRPAIKPIRFDAATVIGVQTSQPISSVLTEATPSVAVVDAMFAHDSLLYLGVAVRQPGVMDDLRWFPRHKQDLPQADAFALFSPLVPTEALSATTQIW
jgi:hypothetical protein